MKLFIASDLHGSAYYTRIMLERYAESGADKLVLLGDIPVSRSEKRSPA